ncbi:MAG: hypothetical protein HRU19_05015 [Pseudobacteriovorax sp.]|nr:hypothetical protein [Pseudobacteriovorax sp.]
MKTLIAIQCLLFAFIGQTAFGKFNWKANKWDKIDSKEGVNVYRKEVPDSDVLGVGGSAMINAPVSKIIWVLMDHENKKDWVDKFESSKTIENPSDLVSIQYAAFDMPFPVSDRDFVYRYEFSYDPDKHMITVDVKSVTHSSAPEEDTIGVRGEIKFGEYRLYPRKNGKKTYVEVEYMTDPKGYLPTMIVNMVQKSWPYKTLSSLRRQVQKSGIKHEKKILDALGVQVDKRTAQNK